MSKTNAAILITVLMTLLASVWLIGAVVPKKPICGRLQLPPFCNNATCKIGQDVEKGCSHCICLPPENTDCPPLTSCRDECAGFELDGDCPKCNKCPDRNDCPVPDCLPGSIMGNPDANNCDTCVTPPQH